MGSAFGFGAAHLTGSNPFSLSTASSQQLCDATSFGAASTVVGSQLSMEGASLGVKETVLDSTAAPTASFALLPQPQASVFGSVPALSFGAQSPTAGISIVIRLALW